MNEDIGYFLYQNRALLEGRLLIPDNQILTLIDKYRFAEQIEKIGLPTPKTYVMASIDEGKVDVTKFLSKGRVGNRFRNISGHKVHLIHTDGDLISLRKMIQGKRPVSIWNHFFIHKCACFWEGSE